MTDDFPLIGQADETKRRENGTAVIDRPSNGTQVVILGPESEVPTLVRPLDPATLLRALESLIAEAPSLRARVEALEAALQAERELREEAERRIAAAAEVLTPRSS